MDHTQDQSKITVPSGHEGHGVHLCHRCGWPFPNPNPSARHRRSHKKICGTIEGYTKLIDSGVVSDDEHHSDEDQQKSPSPKTEEKGSIKGSSGVKSIRSEDDLYSDAVTEFSDTGISQGVEDRYFDSSKTLDRDIFLSFKDNEDAGTTELLHGQVELSKTDANLKVIETLDTHTKDAEKIAECEVTTVPDSTEAKIELLEKDEKPLDHSVKDENVKLTLGQSDGSQPHKAKSIDLVEASAYSAKDVDASKGQGYTLEGSNGKEHGEEAVNVLSVQSDIPVVDHAEALLEDFKDHKAIHSNVPVTLDSKGGNDTVDEISSSADASSKVDTFEVKAGKDKVQETQAPEIDKCSVESINSEYTKTNFSASVPEVIIKEAEVAESQPSEMSKTPPESIDNFIKPEDSSTTGLRREDNKGEWQKSVDKLSDVALAKKSEAVATEENNKELKHEMLESDRDHTAEVVKQSEINLSVSVLTEKEDLGAHIVENYSKEHTQEAVSEHEIDHSGSVLTGKEDRDAANLENYSKERTQESVDEPEIDQRFLVLTEKEDLGAINVEKRSKENTQEVVKEPEIDHNGSVFAKKEDLGAPNLKDSLKEHTQDVAKEPELAHSASVLIEKDDLGASNLENHSKEHTLEVVEEAEIVHSGSVLIEKEDFGAPNFENHSKGHTYKVVKEPEIDHSGSFLTKKNDLVGSNLKNLSKESTEEVVKEAETDNGSKVAMVSVNVDSKDSGDVDESERSLEKIILKEADQSPNDVEHTSENSTTMGDNQNRNNKNASGVVSESIVEEGNGKLMTNQDSGVDGSADSSSHNSLEGNWGSVSVLSIASVDAETSRSVDKSKVNSEKSIAADHNSGKSDVFDPPSLTEPKGEQQDAAASSETKAVQRSQQQPTSEASQAGGSLAHVSNESEGRKRNEEVIAKVTNWSTGKHSAPLKNLLGEAKSPNPKQLSTVIQKDEATEESNGNVAATEKSALPSEAPDMSPPKYIGDGKKVGKKVKGRASWMPFVCCSSVNVGN